MADSYSMTIEKSLIERLQPLICCSESLSTCRFDEFCSSLPAKWPVINNGKEMVRLSYPEKKNSLPGVAFFADAYTTWHSKNGCGALARDVARTVSSKSNLLFGESSSVAGDLLAVLISSKEELACMSELEGAQHKLSKISDSLSSRCPIMFDQENGNPVFKDDRPDDLDELAAFSQKVKEAEAGRMSWGDFFWGGGAAGVILFALWVFYKLVRAAKKGSDKIEGFGMIISSIGANIGLVARGIRRLFGVHIVNLGRTLRYVFTGGWFRGKDLPEMVQDDEHLAVPNPPSVTAKAAPEEAPKEKATPQVEIDPHEDVVLAQLAALEGSQHHLKEGERFSRLSDAGKRYLANLAVARWHDETVERKQYFIADDNRLTEGKLPTSYVMRFARHYLKRNSNIDIIEASARVWVQSLDEPPKPRTEPAKLSEFRPTIIDVKRQLINDPKFGRALAVTRDYIAKMVIAEWESIDPENQPIFVSISDRPETGILPQRFIRFFRKKTLKDIRPLDRRASLYHDLKHQMPELATSPFRLINKRLEQIVRLWYWLPNSIRQSFTGVANREQGRRVKWVPPYFAEYLFKFISISTAARLPIKISKEPWVFQDEPQLTYQEFSLSRVMERIACMTETLRFYPSLLKARSKAVIDAWLLLDRAVRAEFVAADDTHEMISKLELDQGIDALPRAFVNFIHEFSTGVGILPRSDIVLEKAPDDDDGTSGPGGTGSGNIPSSQPPSIPSADMAAIHPGKSEVENTTLAPFAPSFTAYVGPMRHHGVVLPSMSAITMGVPANVNSFVQSGNMLMLGKIHAVDGGMLHQPTPMISPVIRMVGIR